MGWANCGVDSYGRPIGYAYEGTCDEPGCEVEINRGLSYACGGMHGENGVDCERYYCAPHREVALVAVDGREIWVCRRCRDDLKAQGWIEDEDDIILREPAGGHPMMSPTVGRVVHYHKPGHDQPYCALIVYVHNETLVNLVVFDQFGNAEGHTSVYRGQNNYQWDWMPYQKAKAAAGDHNSESAEPRPVSADALAAQEPDQGAGSIEGV